MKNTFFIKSIVLINAFTFFGYTYAQEKKSFELVIDETSIHQTIDNFAASDAWSCQFAGNWPDEKKNAIADWLFSMDTLANGNPKGIGLTLWRYNIGAGSARQGAGSGIRDEWRRAASFAGNTGTPNEQIAAQNWFLSAAKKRGVQQFLGFFNSPPQWLTKNGKAFATKGAGNIDSSNYTRFACHAIDAIKQIQQSTGITFNYISPVNEPQWEWSDGGQEGCPYSNAEISNLIKSFNRAFIDSGITTKIILPEAGHIKYLLKDDDKPGKGNQIDAFFNASSPLFIGDLPTVCHSVATHSYFSTSPFNEASTIRTQTKESISHIPGLQLWQSEYCILGDNAGEIDGRKRDLGMNAALYVAKVIYLDLVMANATAWQWWLAVSPYNYKDGLIYIDKNKTDGNYHDSKMLWAFGNYSRFIRPGMKRVNLSSPDSNLLASAYKDEQTGRLTVVLVNPTATQKTITVSNGTSGYKKCITYTTDAMNNLARQVVTGTHLVIPAQSVVSVILEK